jgi:hypothetical protein
MLKKKYIDLIVNSGRTIQFLGLSSGSSVNLLGVDENGNTILTSGGSGTSGTNKWV